VVYSLVAEGLELVRSLHIPKAGGGVYVFDFPTPTLDGCAHPRVLIHYADDGTPTRLTCADCGKE
jgi:hypothetical protein